MTLLDRMFNNRHVINIIERLYATSKKSIEIVKDIAKAFNHSETVICFQAKNQKAWARTELVGGYPSASRPEKEGLGCTGLRKGIAERSIKLS